MVVLSGQTRTIAFYPKALCESLAALVTAVADHRVLQPLFLVPSGSFQKFFLTHIPLKSKIFQLIGNSGGGGEADCFWRERILFGVRGMAVSEDHRKSLCEPNLEGRSMRA